ncbi:MAG TPA: HIT family protein, partial [Rubrobacteraceae bacterium]|nr:HIT family protein [Rubrobacteraceae bacterium]
MATLFTKIIEGELPARFVYKDERCVAFMTINPIRAGHVLVVPIEEVDHWLDLDPDLMDHLMRVSRTIGNAIQKSYNPEKVGLMLAGLEVPHVHIHLLPIDRLEDMSFEYAEKDP